MSVETLRAKVKDLMPQARADVARTVSFKSVHDASQFPPEERQQMVDYLIEAFTAVGLENMALVEALFFQEYAAAFPTTESRT